MTILYIMYRGIYTVLSQSLSIHRRFSLTYHLQHRLLKSTTLLSFLCNRSISVASTSVGVYSNNCTTTLLLHNFSEHLISKHILNKAISQMADNNTCSEPNVKCRKTTDPNTDKNRLIWIDLEMTGLDVEKDTILEIACIITEGNLEVVAEGPHLIIHHSDKVLDGMNEWCIEHHGKSGLTESVKKSLISLQEAETQVLDFIACHTPAGVCPIAGNSVGTDKFFIDRHMPRLSAHFHYRIVDVSTVKEICRRWYPDTLKQAPQKKLTHRALDDIRESIAELSFYRSQIFK